MRIRTLGFAALAGAAWYFLERGTSAAPPSLALAMLDEARADYELGFIEHGQNAGEEIERLYLAPLGLPPGTPYCAAAITSWMRRAEARMRARAMIQGGALAKGWRDQFAQTGAWTAGPLTLDDVGVGSVLVWDRSDPADPTTAHRGHIGMVELVFSDGSVQTLEANAASFGEPTQRGVSRVTRKLSDPRLLGAGKMLLAA